MKPMLRSGKGVPGVGGARCRCCRTRMAHAKNRRIVRHREKTLVTAEVRRELSQAR